jgi:hypothetical protein
MKIKCLIVAVCLCMLSFKQMPNKVINKNEVLDSLPVPNTGMIQQQTPVVKNTNPPGCMDCEGPIFRLIDPNYVEPLYVIDGIIQSDTSSYKNNMNPNDIESINVVKDSAPIAKYGTSAKGGVIIIKMKPLKVREAKAIYDSLKASRNMLRQKNDKGDSSDKILNIR